MNTAKNFRRSAFLYYLAAGCFYFAAIMNFVKKNTAMGCVYLALSSAFLSLGSAAAPAQGQRAEDAEDADGRAEEPEADRR